MAKEGRKVPSKSKVVFVMTNSKYFVSPVTYGV